MSEPTVEKRYFYTDPLAALWMQKNHEVRFAYDVACDPSEGRFLDSETLYMEPSPIYIHPDSLHLLEPQEGDLCSWAMPCEVIRYGKMVEGEGKAKLTYYGYDYCRIIQRNGIAFMWPESVTL